MKAMAEKARKVFGPWFRFLADGVSSRVVRGLRWCGAGCRWLWELLFSDGIPFLGWTFWQWMRLLWGGYMTALLLGVNWFCIHKWWKGKPISEQVTEQVAPAETVSGGVVCVLERDRDALWLCEGAKISGEVLILQENKSIYSRPTSVTVPAVRVERSVKLWSGDAISSVYVLDAREDFRLGETALWMVDPNGLGTVTALEAKRVYAQD